MLKVKLVRLFFIIFAFDASLFANDVNPSDHKSDKLQVEIFFRQNCSECDKVKNEILPAIESAFGNQCSFCKLDLSDSKNYLR